MVCMEVEKVLSRVDVEILRAYADNRMNVRRAADETRYDRKTVMYHLNRVHINTGLDPKDFWDLHGLMKLIGVEGRCGANP